LRQTLGRGLEPREAPDPKTLSGICIEEKLNRRQNHFSQKVASCAGKIEPLLHLTRKMAAPTIRDLARFCGLSPSAVSAALRNKKNISAATREKVRLAAAEIGYSTDAKFSQLMVYLRSNKSSRNAPSLVLLYQTLHRDDIFVKPWLSTFVSGITSRCEQFGYSFDTMWTGAPDYSPKRINSILESRGVEGIIIFHPNDDYPGHLGINFDHFAVSAIEGDHAGREFPRVDTTSFENIRLALDRVLAMGYLRPGLVLGEWVSAANDDCWRAGYIERLWKLPASRRIPPLIIDQWQGKLPKWLERHRPDVIVCGEAHFRKDLESIGVRVPQDIALVHLNLGSDVPEWAGVDNLHSEIGSASVDMVVAQIHRGETGIPTHPKTILIRGVWRDGETCPAKNAPPGVRKTDPSEKATKEKRPRKSGRAKKVD